MIMSLVFFFPFGSLAQHPGIWRFGEMAMTRLDFSEYRGEQELRMGIYTEAGEAGDAGRILRVLLFASIVILVCCCV